MELLRHYCAMVFSGRWCLVVVLRLKLVDSSYAILVSLCNARNGSKSFLSSVTSAI